MKSIPKILATAAILAMTISPAVAQKSKDMVTISQNLGIAAVDYYLDARPEVAFVEEALFDTLVTFDWKNRKFKPLLAKSWKKIDDVTYEFVLRDDVTWHDGKKFTADDVVYTVNYLIDPNVALRNKAYFDWVSSVEKVNDYTVRIKATEPNPAGLTMIMSNFYIYPKHLHEPLADKGEFGKKAVGTGPYQAVQINKNDGVIIEQRSSYPQGSEFKTRGYIKRIKVVGIPDAGTRLAEFLVGNIDVARDIPANQAASLQQQGKAEVTLGVTGGFYFLQMDAEGRSGLKPLQDVRVREAIHRVIDRSELRRVLVGKWADEVSEPYSLCERSQIGCSRTVELPSQNIAKAKQLMKEAGYADGFDVTITSPLAPGARMAELVSAKLREINVRAKINSISFVKYRQEQPEGKYEIVLAAGGANPDADVSRLIDEYFGEGDRTFHGMPDLAKLVTTANKEMDENKRAAMIEKIYDQGIGSYYMVPITRFPILWVHNKDVKMSGFDRRPLVMRGMYYDFVSWK